MTEFTYKRIVTARGTSFNLGSGYNDYNSSVNKITPTVGDPSLNIPSGYRVEFDNGDIVEVDDVVEAWYSNE